MPQDGPGLGRIVRRPGPESRHVPGASGSIKSLCGFAPATERRLFDRLVVNGMGGGETQLLVLKWSFLQVKEQEGGAERRDLPGLELPDVFFGKVGGVRIRHIVDQIDL